jgi:hypothetical protein
MGFFRRSRRRGELDQVLGHWAKKDPFTARMACQNVAVFGKPGSGKSSGAGNFLLRSYVRHPGTGGLILAAKPEDKAYVTRLFEREGRADDLLLMEPGGDARLNILAYEASRGADSRQLTQLLMLLSETLDSMEEHGQQGGGEPIWKKKYREGLDHAIEVCARAGQLDPWALQCFFIGAALSLEEIADEQWQKGFHWRALERARENAATGLQKHDHEVARSHWLEAWPKLNDRTRTSIESGISSILHVFNTGIVRDMLATGTTIVPEVMEDRKWVLLNAPITPGNATATFINTAVKLVFQRYILRREAGPDHPLLIVFGDEWTKHATSYDSEVFNEARSHKAGAVVLTQSVSRLYASMKGGEHAADALLGQFGHIVLHTCDAKTANFAAEQLGQRLEMMAGGGPEDKPDAFQLLMARGGLRPSFSFSYQPILQSSLLMSGLRCGGSGNDYLVDGIVIRPGAPFSTGENFLLTTFRQD